MAKEFLRTSDWSFRFLAAALGFVAMVLPRLPGFRLSDMGEGMTQVGAFSGWLTDGNVLLMSALLIVFPGVLAWLWPERAAQAAAIVGLAPTVWSVILMVMVLRGANGFWILALAFAFGYGGILAVTGVILAKSAAYLLRARRPPGAP